MQNEVRLYTAEGTGAWLWVTAVSALSRASECSAGKLGRFLLLHYHKTLKWLQRWVLPSIGRIMHVLKQSGCCYECKKY